MDTVTSFVAIGDSFTEGYGDDMPDGSVRGWADLAAAGIAAAQTAPVQYANLAIRGRKLGAIIDEQLDAAIALRPQLLSINGGGNDMLRPRITIGSISGRIEAAVHVMLDAGITPVVVSGANPTGVLPGGALVSRRGDALLAAVRSWSRPLGVLVVDNWSDRTLMEPRFWTEDRLHLNAVGHARAASNFLRALGHTAPRQWRDLEALTDARGRRSVRYYRTHVVPWIGRRLTGRSSGDGRLPKFGEFVDVKPS